MVNPRKNICPRVCVAPRPKRLEFLPVRVADIEAYTRMLRCSGSRSCDFTAGGVFMWIDYFGYESCVFRDTLFIKGLSEDLARRPSFSLPVGKMPLHEAVELIREYCRATGLEPFFSAVPEDRLDELVSCGAVSVEELPDWADYVYNAADLAALSGKKYNKKRNHVNRFMADNPGWKLEELTPGNAPEALAFYQALDIESEKADPVMAEFEREQTLEVLRNYAAYPFEGALLRDGSGAVVAFTAGEVSGDTLVLHIEKMAHSVAGAGEAINKLFAESMLGRYPSLKYINREDDAGEPGLRYAKESYHPAFRLRKYNVLLSL